jgi:hypothetical protein
MLKKVCVAMAMASAFVSLPAQSVTVFSFNNVFAGNSPSSSSPWASLSISNNVGGVSLTLTSSLEIAGEFIPALYLNTNDKTTTASGGALVSGTFALPTVVSNVNGISGGPAGAFDLSINFATSNSNGARFDGLDEYTVALSGLTESDFLSNSQCNPGGGPENCPRTAVLRLQGLGAGNEGSAWADDINRPPNAIPIPAAAWLLGSGLLAMGAIGRRRMSARV